MLDTARELEKQGHTVRFYSYVPDKRAVKFGLKKECNYSVFWFAIPFLILFKIFGHGRWREDLYNYCYDWFLAFYMKPCDVFIGQSPTHIEAIKRAKKKFGAITILERGISHVRFQKKVLKSIEASAHNMSEYHIRRDEEGYKYPDYISVGSDHVRQTFLDNGYPDEKIFVNNYGVNLKFFHPTKYEKEGGYDVIIVGQWCYRKGCDMIIEMVKRLNIKLLHVGSIVDLTFPEDENFTHVPVVPEYKLVDYYAKARVALMPSRDEGLSLVQPQSLACGLPLVCSKYSGGRDLRKGIIDPGYIIEMETYDVESLCTSVEKAIKLSETQDGEVRNIMNSEDVLSYAAYGKRYSDFLQSIAGRRNL